MQRRTYSCVRNLMSLLAMALLHTPCIFQYINIWHFYLKFTWAASVYLYRVASESYQIYLYYSYTLYCIICASSLQREEPTYPPFTPHSSILLPASSQRTQYSSGSMSVLFNCGLHALCAGGPRTEEKYFLTSRPAPFYFLFRFSQCSNCKPGTSSPSSLTTIYIHPPI